MSLAERVYKKHKHVKEAVYLDSGELLDCIAIQNLDGSMMIGFISRELYSRVEWAPHEERLKAIADTPLFREITRVELIKKGFFALSRLCFTTSSGETVTGKTDKGFSEMILS